ncbi:alanyl-tRNA synthetase [Pedobacter sp. AW31-3R]
MESQEHKSKKDIFLKWFKRVGIWGFVFFLAKGLLWLALGYWVIK